MNNFIPPTYAGNLVRLDESVLNGVLVAPPAGRWRAIHNTHTAAVTVKAPANQVLKYIASDGDDRSDVHGANSNGKLVTGDDFISIILDAAIGTTASESTGGISGDVTVTRRGVDVTSKVTPPSFDGITTNSSGDVTAVIVNAVGDLLKTGDVITFPFIDEASLNTGDIITLTLVEDNIKLDAGFYALTATTATTIHTLDVGETIYVDLNKVEIDSDANTAVVTAYFG